MSSKPYDLIVLGCGGVGSAALYGAARRGLRVLGLDQFAAGHDRGSSHGQTRIIRQAYFEHAHYVPLLKRAYELWAELEREANEQLFFRTGLLQVGPADGLVVPGVLRSAAEHGLPVDALTAADVARQFPGFHVNELLSAVFEANAGYLRVEACVLAHLAAARRLGAEIHAEEPAVSWQANGRGVIVNTSQGEYAAAGLILAAGPWAAQILAENADSTLRNAARSLRVLKKHLHWFGCNDVRYAASPGAPCYLYELPHGVFYGFPAIDERGLKVGEHSGGELVPDPLHVERSRDAADFARVTDFVSHYLPGSTTQATGHTTCFYTMTPDENFLLDRHPQFPHVTFAAGLSGHGFKFTSVLGEILVDLATTGHTALTTEFLSLARFASRAAQHGN